MKHRDYPTIYEADDGEIAKLFLRVIGILIAIASSNQMKHRDYPTIYEADDGEIAKLFLRVVGILIAIACIVVGIIIAFVKLIK